MKRRWLLIALLIVGVLGGLGYLANRPKPLAVELATTTRQNLEKTVVNTRAGTVVACRRAELSPATGGVVTELAVKKGDRVKPNDLLLQLWNADARAERELAISQFSSAQAQADEACTMADWADRDAKRLERLHGKSVVSEEDLDRASAESKAKRAHCNASKIAVEVAERRIKTIDATLERSQLKAPFAGVVAETNAELGEYVTPSPPGIATRPPIDLIDDSCLFIRAPVDETDAASVKLDMSARISLDALPGKLFVGQVSRIAPYILDREKQARTVDIEVKFSNIQDTEGLLVGYSADIEIVIEKRENVVVAPSSSIDNNGQIWLFEDNTQTLRRITPKLGLRNWTQTEIIEGLDVNQSVVVSPNLKLVSDGVNVRRKTPDETESDSP